MNMSSSSIFIYRYIQFQHLYFIHCFVMFKICIKMFAGYYPNPFAIHICQCLSITSMWEYLLQPYALPVTNPFHIFMLVRHNRDPKQRQTLCEILYGLIKGIKNPGHLVRCQRGQGRKWGTQDRSGYLLRCQEGKWRG